MSSKLPFDDAFRRKMNDLSSSGEDESWEKMKQLLNEKDDYKPFAWLKLAAVATGLLFLFLSVYFILTRHEKSDTVKHVVSSVNDTNSGQMPPVESHAITKNKNQKERKDSAAMKAHLYNPNAKQEAEKNISLKNSSALKTPEVKRKRSLDTRNSFADKLNLYNQTPTAEHIAAHKNITNHDTATLEPLSEKENLATNKNTASDSLPAVDSDNSVTAAKPINNNNNKTQTAIKKDSLQTALHNDSVTAKTKSHLKKARPFTVDAGIQLRQQLPVGGKQFIAYNYHGNKNLLADYIPFVYARLEKDKRWFVQAEFNYAVPQFLKQFSYSRETLSNYVHSTAATTTYYLQKTYYSELPVSFNYYVQPKWSVGAGGSFTWLRGAVVNKEVIVDSILTQQSITSSSIIPVKNYTDSFLYKSQINILLQTSYTTRKWSFNLRYLQGLQPFIKYTLPDGTIDYKRNYSLHLIVGYRLFRSSKFTFK